MKKLDKFDSAPASQLLNINDACALLDISRATFYRLVKANKIRLIKVGCGSRASVGNLRQIIGVA